MYVGEIVFLPMRRSLATAGKQLILSEGKKDRREKERVEIDYVQQISINGIADPVVQK